MQVSQSTIQRVRDVPLTSILESEGVPFKKIGREAVTLCPWHNDTKPSLTINDDKGLCFCFACGGGSDGIAYVQQKFALSFSDAVLRIASGAGLQVQYDDVNPEEARRIAAERQQKLSRLQAEHARFRRAIRTSTGARAREWLIARGITGEASQHFELGWAEDGWFAGRVMVPIHDHRGTLVGFTGRSIDWTPDQDEKYKNSAASEIFDKGAIFYNEHRAYEQARRFGFMVIVEGHLDVISLWQQGLPNAVAIQGTAPPSQASIQRLKRYCKHVVIACDSDKGGRAAVGRFLSVAGSLACAGELTISVAQLPEGMDPDDCVRAGLDINQIIESAESWLDWQIDGWLAGLDRSDTFRFSQAEKAVRELVESIRSPALRQYYLDKASKVLAADPKAAAKLASQWESSLPQLQSRGEWSRPAPTWTRHQAERRALRAYLHFPGTRPKLRPCMERLQAPAHIWLWRRICELELFCESITPEVLSAVLVAAEPHYLRTLRPLLQPTIQLVLEDGLIEHTTATLTADETIDLGTAA